MSVTVKDCNGNDIRVGTRVVYGGIESQIAEVTAISDPDIVEQEDEFGREYVSGRALDITIRFNDGDTETVRAHDITPWSSLYNGPDVIDDPDEVFEEPGDIEVISR